MFKHGGHVSFEKLVVNSNEKYTIPKSQMIDMIQNYCYIHIVSIYVQWSYEYHSGNDDNNSNKIWTYYLNLTYGIY